VASSDASAAPASQGRARERLKLLGALLAGVLITLFAVLNLDQVSVNWLIGTWSTPLIVVIVVSALLGAALDRGLRFRARRTRRKALSPGVTPPERTRSARARAHGPD
jgi:uncharacterized integral membrane protein